MDIRKIVTVKQYEAMAMRDVPNPPSFAAIGRELGITGSAVKERYRTGKTRLMWYYRDRVEETIDRAEMRRLTKIAQKYDDTNEALAFWEKTYEGLRE